MRRDLSRQVGVINPIVADIEDKARLICRKIY
jgi:tetrahydromethanopterin S-methyltransferase subunit F